MPTEQRLYYTDQVFKTEFPITGITETQFDGCKFENCDFTEVNFSGCDFINCIFSNCNLSMTKFGHIGFDKVHFKDCKLVGADFSTTKDFLFSVDFTNCIMDYVAFMKKKNKKALFDNCRLKGADFSEADLSSVTFHNCDLGNAVFMRTLLTGANLVTAFNFTIDPEKNNLRKAKFAAAGLIGLLHNYGIRVVDH